MTRVIVNALSARPAPMPPADEIDVPEAAEARATSAFRAPLMSSVRETIKNLFHKRTPTTHMLDLKDVLAPEALAQVDPRVVDFYANPTAYDLRAGVDMGFAGKGLLPLLGILAHEGQIPDR